MRVLEAVGVGLAVTVLVAVLGTAISRFRWRQSLLRTMAAISTATVTVGVMGGVAWAYQSSQVTGWTYESAVLCTKNHVYIDNNTGKPHVDSWTEAWIETPEGICTYQHNMPNGYIRVAQDLWVYLGKWAICNAGAFYYNGVTSDIVKTGFNFNHPCGGPFWWYADTEGEIQNGSVWYGGFLETPGSVYI